VRGDLDGGVLTRERGLRTLERPRDDTNLSLEQSDVRYWVHVRVWNMCSDATQRRA
jgi:uncharacterized protein (DUF2384 family)